jgi:hypothetical protein
MPDDDSQRRGDSERRWVVAPPDTGEIVLHMAVGEGVELTSAQRDALNDLLRALESSDPEVSGFEVGCPSYAGTCSAKRQPACPSKNCQPFSCDHLHTQSAEIMQSWSLMGSFRPGIGEGV